MLLKAEVRPFVSLVASFILLPLVGGSEVKAINGVLDQYKNWAFVLAFTSIGLDTNFKSLARNMQGGKVLWLYVIGQTFNIALTLFAPRNCTSCQTSTPPLYQKAEHALPRRYATLAHIPPIRR